MINKDIKFNKKEHVYTYKGKKLISATQLVESWFEKFDEKGIARKLAKFPVNKANKKGVRYWLNKWKQTRDDGTRIHKYLENYALYGELKGLNITDASSITNKVSSGIAFYKKFITEAEEPVSIPELRIAHPELGIAGTVDLLIGHIINGKRVYSIIDWKSNDKITEKSDYNKKGLHTLLVNYDDCHLTKYSLQLSIYAYILEEVYKVSIHSIMFVHLQEGKATPYYVVYKKDLIKELLEDKR